VIRRGVTDQAASPEDEHPLFGTQAQAQLRSIAASDIWQSLRAGIEAQREALLSTPLASTESLAERWGAIQQLSLLLHGGPQMILQQAQLARSAAEAEVEAPREYHPSVHQFKG